MADGTVVKEEGGAGGAEGPAGAGADAKGRKVEASQRITTRYMTKYEKARILGTRALQLRWVRRERGTGATPQRMRGVGT